MQSLIRYVTTQKNYAAKLRSNGVKFWDKCCAGQIHMLLGLPQAADELEEFANTIKTAMNESFKNNPL